MTSVSRPSFGRSRAIVTRRYIGALGAIGLLAIAEYVTLDVLVRNQQDRAEALEQTARQRMYMQRATVLSQQMPLTGAAGRTELRTELHAVTGRLAELHYAITHDARDTTRTRDLTRAMQQMYFEDPFRLETRLHDYIETARTFADAPDSAVHLGNPAYRRLIDAASGPTAAALDSLVSRLVTENEHAVGRVRIISAAMLLAMLLGLLTVAGFMFEPLVRQIQREALLLEEANEELRQLSALDGLTGIANRRAFEERIDEEWRRAVRDSASIALLMIDIDHFKLYNDRYGHLQGDDCLVHLAQGLRRAVSRPADFIARYGGEEFAVILPDTDLHGAVNVAENLRSRVATLGIRHEASPVHHAVTISVGAATVVPSPEMGVAVLIAAADRTLYRAKQNGRNRVESEWVAGGAPATAGEKQAGADV